MATMSSLDLTPTLGSKPVPIKVSLPSKKAESTLATTLRTLYQKGEFCDLDLTCGEQRFPCHKTVLTAMSVVFAEGLRKAEGGSGGERPEVRLTEVSNPEAVRFMLDFMYEMDSEVWRDYNPATQEINKDVLRLAERFQLPALTLRATHWLAKDITTGNAVERLAICSEFGLKDLRSKIIQVLTTSRTALQEVAHSPKILEHPELMQALLQQAAGHPSGGETTSPPTKKAKKGGK